MADLDRLITLLARDSARHGQFTLSSGRTSSLYIDARLTTMSPEGLSLIGPLAIAAITDAGWNPDSVGGLTLGADPIAYAIAYASARSERPIRAFTVRKEPKGHGAGRQIEGPFSPDDTVVVIEDVITTGGSALRAAEVVRKAGATIAGVFALIDRQEGGREAIEGKGYAVRSLVTASEIVKRMPSSGHAGAHSG
jgi:orotate phosphoribosyltransferase